MPFAAVAAANCINIPFMRSRYIAVCNRGGGRACTMNFDGTFDGNKSLEMTNLF